MGFTSPQLAQASLVTQAGGAISSAIGGYFGAKSSKAALASQAATLNGQAAIADTNARIAELGAQSALMQGEKQVASITLKAGQLKSSQRAAMAANGIDLGEGSAAEIQASTDIMKEVDSNTITANAVSNAWGYKTQATNYKNEALMKRTGADSVSASAGSISPFSAAATSLLGGATSVASSWYGLNKATANTTSTGAIGATPGYSSGDLGNGLRF
jgi:hypothetical protein